MTAMHRIPNVVATPTGPVKLVGKRYCEGCHRYQPSDRRPHRKGWRCQRCIDAAASR